MIHCEYKFKYKITEEEKIDIGLMIIDKVPIKQICDKYGLTQQFLKCQYRRLNGMTPASLGSKTESYYENEMDYGLKTKRI